MAASNIELIVDAVKAINPLRQVQRESQKVENGIRDLNGRLRENRGRFIQSGHGASQASRAFSGLGKSVAGLAGAYLGLSAAQNAVREGIQRIESERRIEFLAKGYGEIAVLQDAASQSAEKFGISQTDANKALADVYARLRPVNVEMEDIVSIFNGFNTAARISGSSSVEASNAFRQLSQALGSGALRGDEFNSIAEQVPGILTAIADETGVAQGQLRDFAAEGGITADIVIRALRRIEVEGANQLEAALDGPAQAVADFQNAMEELQVATTTSIVPALSESFKELAVTIELLEGPLEKIGNLIANSITGLNYLIKDFSQPVADNARDAIEAGFAPLSFRGAMLHQDPYIGARKLFGADVFSEIEKEAEKLSVGSKDIPVGGSYDTQILIKLMKDRLAEMNPVTAELEAPTAGATTLPLPPVPFPSPTLEENKTDETRVDLSDKYIQLLRERIELSKGENAIGIAMKENEMRMLEIAESSLLPNERIKAELLSQERLTGDISEIQEKNLSQWNDGIAAVEAFGTAIANDYIAKLQEAQQPIEDLFNRIGDSITTNIVNGLAAAVEGTKTLGEAASDVLRSVGSVLLQFGVQTALSGIAPDIFKFGGKREKGGSVVGGNSYLVGERGPELFTPGRSGNIAPSGSFGGANVVVNVDATGTQVQDNQPSAKALGVAIGAAVQAELVKQKRPGGLLN